MEPSIQLAAKPKTCAAAATIKYGPRHVGVAALIQVNGRCVRKTKQLGDVMRVGKIFEVDQPSHSRSVGATTLRSG